MNNSSSGNAGVNGDNTDSIGFYCKLNDSYSLEIQKMISNYIINDFPNIELKSKKEISEHIQQFITKLIEKFVKVWKIEIDKDEKAYYEICDGFESVLMKKLYNRLFSTTKEEKESDYLFELQTSKYSFVTPEHLDINKNIINEVYIATAINKLAMINQYKCPKDKISTIINFSNILSTMIINHPSKSESLFPGADEVLPIVVYSLLKGNIRKLKSNLTFIKLFRHHTRFDSNKEEYFTTVLQSGVEFIDKLNTSTDLNIDKQQLEAFLKESEAQNRLRLSKYIQPEIRNGDENYLLYHLTTGTGTSIGNKKNESSSSISNSINNNNAGDQKEIIELIDHYSNACKINTTTTINKSLLNKDKGIFDIDLEKLSKEYFEKDLKDFSMFELEKMVNDFRITLKLTEKYLNTLKKNENENDN